MPPSNKKPAENQPEQSNQGKTSHASQQDLLLSAVLMNRKQKVKDLIEQGADVNHLYEEFGCRVLDLAVKNGNIRMVKTLLKSGAHVDNKTTNVLTALHSEALSGNKDMVALLCAYTNKIDVTDQNGQTPLHIAASHGHSDIVKILANRTRNIDLADSSGFSPLDLAAIMGHKDNTVRKEYVNTMGILLQQGAQINETIATKVDIYKTITHLLPPIIDYFRQQSPEYRHLCTEKTAQKMDKETLINRDQMPVAQWRNAVNKF